MRLPMPETRTVVSSFRMESPCFEPGWYCGGIGLDLQPDRVVHDFPEGPPPLLFRRGERHRLGMAKGDFIHPRPQQRRVERDVCDVINAVLAAAAVTGGAALGQVNHR